MGSGDYNFQEISREYVTFNCNVTFPEQLKKSKVIPLHKN